MTLPTKSHISIGGMEFSILSERYRQSSQNPARAKFGSGTTKYEDLQNSSAFVTENWQFGLAQTDAEAGGLLFAAGVDSRFEQKLILGPRSFATVQEDPGTRHNSVVPMGDITSRLTLEFGGTIEAIGHICVSHGYTEFWAYLEAENGTSIKVSTEEDDGTPIGTDTVVIDTKFPGPQWHHFEVPNCIDLSANVYPTSRLILEPAAAGDKFTVPLTTIDIADYRELEQLVSTVWSDIDEKAMGFISGELVVAAPAHDLPEPGFVDWGGDIYFCRAEKIYRYNDDLSYSWEEAWDLLSFEVRSWTVFNNRLHMVGYDSYYDSMRHFVMLDPTDAWPAEMVYYKHGAGTFTSMDHKLLLNWGGLLYAAGDYTIQYSNCDEEEWDTVETFADLGLGQTITMIQTDSWYPHGFDEEYERNPANFEPLDGTAPNDSLPVVKKYDALGYPWLVPTDRPQELTLSIVDPDTWTYSTLDTFGEQVVSTDFVINALAPLSGNRVAISTDQGMYVFESGDVSVPRTAWGSYSRENGLFSVAHKGELYTAADHRFYRFVESALSSSMIDIWLNPSEELPDGYIGPISGVESFNSYLIVSVNALCPSVLAWTGEGWHSLIALPRGMTISNLYFDRRDSRLFVSTERGFVFTSTVPDTTTNPLRDTAYKYTPSGWFEYPIFFGGLKELFKDCHSVYVTGDGISEASPVDIYWKDDYSTAWEYLGSATSERSEIGWRVYETPTPLQRRPETREIQLGFVVHTDLEGNTPVIKAVRLKFHQNIEDFDNWSLVVCCADNIELIDGTPSPYTAEEQREHLEVMRKSVAPVWFTDLDGRKYLVEVRGTAIEIDRDSLKRINGANEYDSIHTLTLIQVEGANDDIEFTG